MPSEIIDVNAIEGSTYVVTATFTDAIGEAVTPKTLAWTLSTTGGTVVNERSQISVVATSNVVNIVLSGDDLKLRTTGDNKKRVLTFEGTYDSELGDDLPLKDQIIFSIYDLIKVAPVEEL